MPTNEYGSKEKVKATKHQKCPVPSEFPHIISGKQFISLYLLMCLQIFDNVVTCYYSSLINSFFQIQIV